MRRYCVLRVYEEIRVCQVSVRFVASSRGRQLQSFKFPSTAMVRGPVIIVSTYSVLYQRQLCPSDEKRGNGRPGSPRKIHFGPRWRLRICFRATLAYFYSVNQASTSGAPGLFWGRNFPTFDQYGVLRTTSLIPFPLASGHRDMFRFQTTSHRHVVTICEYS